MKTLLGIFLLLTGLMPLYSQVPQAPITVVSSTGKVERESPAGTWTAVTPGQVLQNTWIIRTAQGSTLTLRQGPKVLLIQPLQRGSVLQLLEKAQPVLLRVGQAAEAKTTQASNPRGNTSTASTRADIAPDEDILWVEEPEMPPLPTP